MSTQQESAYLTSDISSFPGFQFLFPLQSLFFQKEKDPLNLGEKGVMDIGRRCRDG